MHNKPTSISEAMDIVAYYEQTNEVFKGRWRPNTNQYLYAVQMVTAHQQEQALSQQLEEQKILATANKVLGIKTLEVSKEGTTKKFVLTNTSNNKTFCLEFLLKESIYLLCLHSQTIRQHLLACLMCLSIFACSSKPTSKPPSQQVLVTTEVEQGIWYPQSELKVIYRGDTFQVIAVDIINRKSIIRRKTKQTVKPLDSLKLVE